MKCLQNATITQHFWNYRVGKLHAEHNRLHMAPSVIKVVASNTTSVWPQTHNCLYSLTCSFHKNNVCCRFTAIEYSFSLLVYITLCLSVSFLGDIKLIFFAPQLIFTKNPVTYTLYLATYCNWPIEINTFTIHMVTHRLCSISNSQEYGNESMTGD